MRQRADSHPNPPRLADTIDFSILGPLAHDAKESVSIGLEAGVVFGRSGNPLEVFRDAVSASIRDIQTHPRGQLLQRFLKDGPYEREGDIPVELQEKRLTDAETAAAIRFIYYFMINSFQGAVAEILAVHPCLRVIDILREEKRVPKDARLYIGDTVVAGVPERAGKAKAADMHILVNCAPTARRITLAGIAEVKSYSRRWNELSGQLDRHLARACSGLYVNGRFYSAEQVTVGYNSVAVRIGVVPSQWKLPRTFHWEAGAVGRGLHVDRRPPPLPEDQVMRRSESDWLIALRWSREALAEAAYAMTFWYMEKAGEVIYTHGVPLGWSRMTAAEAGINAAKMMLYYAIPRSRTAREYQRAVALFNTYGFGYALGMNFRDEHGYREMLWPEDLDEILAMGQTKHKCWIGS